MKEPKARRLLKLNFRPRGVETKNSGNLNSLWIAIKNFDIDGSPAELPFAKRLARDNNWSPGFANRVIEEYRRFLFLAMVSGHPVSPSKIVDEAWHLHLLYTESYWNRLTKEVLPFPLHHHPTKGGKAEAKKHADLYDHTRESYRKHFEQEPPSDIWPTFSPNSQSDRNYVWKMSKLSLRRWAIGGASITAILGLGVGCTPILAQNPSSTSTIILLITGLGVVIVGGMIAMFMLGNRDSANDTTNPNDPLHDKKDTQNTGGTYSSCGGSGGTGTHSHHGDGDGRGDGNADSGGGDSGGDGGGCGGGCSS